MRTDVFVLSIQASFRQRLNHRLLEDPRKAINEHLFQPLTQCQNHDYMIHIKKSVHLFLIIYKLYFTHTHKNVLGFSATLIFLKILFKLDKSYLANFSPTVLF